MERKSKHFISFLIVICKTIDTNMELNRIPMYDINPNTNKNREAMVNSKLNRIWQNKLWRTQA